MGDIYNDIKKRDMGCNKTQKPSHNLVLKILKPSVKLYLL